MKPCDIVRLRFLGGNILLPSAKDGATKDVEVLATTPGGDILVLDNGPYCMNLLQRSIDQYKSTKYLMHPNIVSFVNTTVRWYSDKLAILVPNTTLLSVDIKQNIISKAPWQSSIDGACCAICKNFTVYAESGFTCFSCRTDKYRASPLGVEDDDFS